MAKKLVSELDGYELDYWVAICMQETFTIEDDGSICVLDPDETLTRQRC